jgi:hypothetical protein
MASRTARRGTHWSRSNTSRGAIPAPVQEALLRRLEYRLRAKWSRAQVDVVVKFRSRFAYVGYVDQSPRKASQDGRELVPFPLFRLGYQGDPALWLFSLFTYSNERYEPCIGASGDFTASPEQAFDCAARLYLSSLA